jgi:hypothetical protein
MMNTTRNRGQVSKSGSFFWNDVDPNQSLGPGLSRPQDGEITNPYALRVRPPHQPPMRVVLMAADLDKAIAYASARWPQAAIQAVEITR